MKTYIVDRTKWVRGGDEETYGKSALLNTKGFQCCLGFVCEQEGVSRYDLLNTGSPDILQIVIPNITYIPESGVCVYNTISVSEAMLVNDDKEIINDDEREKQLNSIFAQDNIELKFIN